MKTTSIWVSLGIILLSLASHGCALPSSKHPLSDETTSKIDDRLLGSWQMVEQDQAATFKVEVARLDDRPNVLKMTATPVERTEENGDKSGFCFSTKIGKENYLSVDLKPEEKADAKEYLIMRYEIEGNLLHFSLFEPEFIAKAIERRELNGNYKRKTTSPREPANSGRLESVKITAETPDLVAFVAKHGRAAFGEKAVTFKRLAER